MGSSEVRIAGFGGQGVVLAGLLLGRAALEDGLYAIQNQSYGAEARGGAARSEVIISTEVIVYPEVVAPTVMAAMSQAGADRYLPDLRPDGTLIVDAGLVSSLPSDLPHRVLRAPFTQVASEELGRQIVANMVMLGFLASATQVVSLDSLRRAVSLGVPRGTEELNLKALDRGVSLAHQSTEEGDS